MYGSHPANIPAYFSESSAVAVKRFISVDGKRVTCGKFEPLLVLMLVGGTRLEVDVVLGVISIEKVICLFGGSTWLIVNTTPSWLEINWTAPSS